jgi:hypothetical protein
VPFDSEYLNLHGELILIGGAYKSGTSLLCKKVERLGFRNPAVMTNYKEHGHGISTKLYLTRECSTARNWNRLLLRATPREQEWIQRQLVAYLAEMLSEMGPKIVLKDPCMKITAPYWFRAAHSLGISSRRLLLTERDSMAVNNSNLNSKFLRWKKWKEPTLFKQLAAPMAIEACRQLAAHSVDIRKVKYQALVWPGGIGTGFYLQNSIFNSLAGAVIESDNVN